MIYSFKLLPRLPVMSFNYTSEETDVGKQQCIYYSLVRLTLVAKWFCRYEDKDRKDY